MIYLRKWLQNGIPLKYLATRLEVKEELTPMHISMLESILREWALNTPLWALKGWRCSEVNALRYCL